VSSIASTGFGLSALCIGVDRGWLPRAAVSSRVRTTLETFWNGPQGNAANGMIGYKGLFYHWLDMNTATRTWDSELSTIDTALLMAGILDAKHHLAVQLDGADAVLESDERVPLPRRVQRHGLPDALVHEPRAEVPPVAHPALVHAHAARPPDLGLALGRGVDDHREHVLAVGDVDLEGGERALVPTGLLAVDEDARRVVDTLEASRARPHDAAPVDPRALRHPFRQEGVAHPVRVGGLPRADEVVEDAAGHAGGQPARRVPRLRQVPLPLVAEAAAQLPLVPVEAYRCHSSRVVSRTGAPASRGTRKVLSSCGRKSTVSDRSRSGSSILPRAVRPEVS